jgi:putative Holliday junction resolvase
VSRILAVDWGTKRVGMAVSDPTGLVARPLPTLGVRNAREASEKVLAAARDEGAELILVGLPLNMDGTEGASAERARKLGEALAAGGFAVRYLDERLTSEAARDLLRERGETRPAPERVDQAAALILLEGYLAGAAREGRDA